MNTYIRERMRALFQLNDTPHKLAFAFALGIFIAFTPTIGLHIVSCLLLASLFRVSKIVTLTASFFNNPWTMVPLYGFCVWVGSRVTGEHIRIQAIAWNNLSLSNFTQMLRPFLWSYVIGTLLVGIVAAVISYFLFYGAVVRYRKERDHRALAKQGKAEDR